MTSANLTTSFRQCRDGGATACVAKDADYDNLMDAIRGFALRPGAVAGA